MAVVCTMAVLSVTVVSCVSMAEQFEQKMPVYDYILLLLLDFISSVVSHFTVGFIVCCV